MLKLVAFLLATAGAAGAAGKSPIVPALDCSQVQSGPPLDSFESLAYQLSVAAVRHLLARYPLAVDGRNWDDLQELFTSDAVANFPEPLGSLRGPAEIAISISSGLSNFGSTQHSYSTQIIELCSKTKAVALTYVTAAHFFVPIPADLSSGYNMDKALYSHGQYRDIVVKGKDGKWRISKRDMIIMVSGQWPSCGVMLTPVGAKHFRGVSVKTAIEFSTKFSVYFSLRGR